MEIQYDASWSDNSHLFGIPVRLENQLHGFVEMERDLEGQRRLTEIAVAHGIELHIAYKKPVRVEG